MSACETCGAEPCYEHERKTRQVYNVKAAAPAFARALVPDPPRDAADAAWSEPAGGRLYPIVTAFYDPDSPRTSEVRKGQPIATGVLAYFPRAMAAISEHSRHGNDKHNPGEPLHWARDKSTDEADSAVRHITDALAEGPLALDADGRPHLVGAAWRVLAWLERVLDGDERWRTVAPKNGGAP